jgi:5'-deoxynucleotidase YfbR-like HD superfamily hydrolase
MSFLKSYLPVIAGMSSVKRYSMQTMSRSESVLEHTGWVALTALLICDRLDLEDELTGIVLQKALLHDVEEVVLGDVARPTKHHSADTKAMFKILGGAAVSKIERLLDVVVTARATNAKRDDTGSIVALCDMLAVVYKVWDEVIVRGNLSMVGHAEKIQDQLKDFKRLLSLHWQNDQLAFLLAIVDDAIDIAAAAAARDRDFNFRLTEEFDNAND